MILRIIDDLVRSRFAKGWGTQDGAFGLKSRAIAWSKDGTELIACYANALRTIRNPTKRKVEMFNALLVTEAIGYMRERGWIIDD